LRDAARLIAKTPELLATDFDRMLKGNFAKWSADVDFATGWGFFDGVPPEGGIPFAEVVQQSWCGYKNRTETRSVFAGFRVPGEVSGRLASLQRSGTKKVLVNKIAKKTAQKMPTGNAGRRAKQVP